ncbi:MAG: HNH endonuclease [Rhodobacter sp.]|nr:HNH endonuclease [Rhodobacter sp.]
MPDFLAPRACFRDPIPEIFHAAELLDRAVDAHLAGDRALTARLIASADMPKVREWVESIWGSASRDIHRVREVKGAPPTLGEAARDPRRKATGGQERALIERDGFRCGFCGIPVVRTEIRQAMHREYPRALPWGRRNAEQHAAFQCLWMQFDHVLPHSRGGRTDLDNLVVTCGPCNYGRSEATLEEVGLVDPRTRPLPRSGWDGLERFLS